MRALRLIVCAIAMGAILNLDTGCASVNGEVVSAWGVSAESAKYYEQVGAVRRNGGVATEDGRGGRTTVVYPRGMYATSGFAYNGGVLANPSTSDLAVRRFLTAGGSGGQYGTAPVVSDAETQARLLRLEKGQGELRQDVDVIQGSNVPDMGGNHK